LPPSSSIITVVAYPELVNMPNDLDSLTREENVSSARLNPGWGT